MVVCKSSWIIAYKLKEKCEKTIAEILSLIHAIKNGSCDTDKVCGGQVNV